MHACVLRCVFITFEWHIISTSSYILHLKMYVEHVDLFEIHNGRMHSADEYVFWWALSLLHTYSHTIMRSSSPSSMLSVNKFGFLFHQLDTILFAPRQHIVHTRTRCVNMRIADIGTRSAHGLCLNGLGLKWRANNFYTILLIDETPMSFYHFHCQPHIFLTTLPMSPTFITYTDNAHRHTPNTTVAEVVSHIFVERECLWILIDIICLGYCLLFMRWMCMATVFVHLLSVRPNSFIGHNKNQSINRHWMCDKTITISPIN